MNLYNVIEVPTGYAETLAPEILRQQREIGSRHFTYLLTLEPEQPPFLGKLTERLDTFTRLRDILQPHGIQCGILIQALLAHGERGQLRSPASFQRIVNADGSLYPATFCPLDPGFQGYIAEGITVIMGARPDFLMTDDDVRLVHGSHSKGCFCPLHLQLFNDRTGRNFSRADLLHHVALNDTEGEKIRQEWNATEEESLLRIVRIVRASIDAITPSLRAGICVNPSLRLLNDRLSRAMAGETRPFIRLAGAVYFEQSTKTLPYKFDFVLRQRRHIAPDTEILLEADTYPQHQFGTSAAILRAYVETATLLGIDSAKIWIEPIPALPFGQNRDYVEAYRGLKTRLPFLQSFAKSIRWRGGSSLVKDDEIYRLPWTPQSGKQLVESAWPRLFGRLALPHLPGGEDTQSLRCFDGRTIQGYSREECLDFLKGPLLLDGEAAAHLTALGLGEHLGVESCIDPDLYQSGERYSDEPEWNGWSAGLIRSASKTRPENIYRLSPIDPGVRIAGEYIARPWRQSPDITPVAPSVTLFENHLGGRVAIYAASLPRTLELHFATPYRRQQLTRILRWLAPEDYAIGVETDRDLYLLIGDLPDGGVLLHALNLQADPIPSLTLTGDLSRYASMSVLNPQNEWETLPVRLDGETIAVPTPLNYLQSCTLLLRP